MPFLQSSTFDDYNTNKTIPITHTEKHIHSYHMYMLHCNLGLIAFNVHSLVDKIFYKLYLENHKKINAPYLMTILHVVLYNHPSHKDPLFKMHFILFLIKWLGTAVTTWSCRHCLPLLFIKKKPSKLAKMQICIKIFNQILLWRNNLTRFKLVSYLSKSFWIWYLNFCN